MNLSVLKRFVSPPVTARADEKCEMCAKPIGHQHSHVVNVESRGLLCTCRPCFLLFTNDGAGAGKFRAVPDRVLKLDSMQVDERSWDQLEVPVRLAFFFKNSSLGKTVAFYPSPAGATESTLPLQAWQALVAAHPVLGGIAPDVEALLVRGQPHQPFESYLVPINVCYELVGRVRQTWKGFDGGDAARHELDRFFTDLRERSEAA